MIEQQITQDPETEPTTAQTDSASSSLLLSAGVILFVVVGILAMIGDRPDDSIPEPTAPIISEVLLPKITHFSVSPRNGDVGYFKISDDYYITVAVQNPSHQANTSNVVVWATSSDTNQTKRVQQIPLLDIQPGQTKTQTVRGSDPGFQPGIWTLHAAFESDSNEDAGATEDNCLTEDRVVVEPGTMNLAISQFDVRRAVGGGQTQARSITLRDDIVFRVAVTNHGVKTVRRVSVKFDAEWKKPYVDQRPGTVWIQHGLGRSYVAELKPGETKRITLRPPLDQTLVDAKGTVKGGWTFTAFAYSPVYTDAQPEDNTRRAIVTVTR